MKYPRKSQLKTRKIHYDQVYKEKRMNLVRDKYARFIQIYKYKCSIFYRYPIMTELEYFKDPEFFLETIEDLMVDAKEYYNRKYYKRLYWNLRKLPGKCVKGKDYCVTPQERDWVSEKVYHLNKVNKNIALKEIKEYKKGIVDEEYCW